MTTQALATPLIYRNNAPDQVLSLVYQGEKSPPELELPADQLGLNTCEFQITIVNKTTASFTFVSIEVGSGDGWIRRPRSGIVVPNDTISFGVSDATLATALLTMTTTVATINGQVKVNVEALGKVPLTGTNMFTLKFDPGSYFLARRTGNSIGWDANITWTIQNL